MSWYTNAKVWSFVGGAAAAFVGSAVATLPQTRDVVVRIVAKGMEVQQCASEEIQNIRDEATDIAEEARRQARIDAARADKRAQIEARIREQVEAEMAAEDEKEAEGAAKAEAEIGE